ncbi:E3 ubiquitin-protein ligase trul-1-like [Mya arenaria]|uniref:E3 ubiquitin-protein ligase trul-1-like n=1 Tax=Mya arenaria TaxID=6604 RepID=UPI0022E97142|nr:E3 ubiquitin-protein ligase trul-1-like [Mya arenaria]
MEDELPLLVPLSALSDYIQCSICMCNLDKTMMTMCGHRYCEKCITEWVGRQHKCPCCNHALDASQLVKDHQFDSLISAIDGEKEKAETKYFESLINAASTENEESADRMSSVELVLKKHLKKGLLDHESYLKTLRKSFSTKLAALETTTERAVVELQTHGLSESEVCQQTADLLETLERQKTGLEAELHASIAMVAEAYDKYLGNHIPNLDVLPVKGSIILAGKNTNIPDLTFQPTDSLTDVRSYVESTMTKKHNPVVSWEPDAKYFLFGPFAKCSDCEMERAITDYLTTGSLALDVQFLTEGAKLGLQYAMKPGSVIVVYGGLKLESDLPKKCFVEAFKKGDSIQRVDYFACSQCNFKWICRSCMEICHLGHAVVPYIMQHQPNWACCYCPKKKCCKIQTTG